MFAHRVYLTSLSPPTPGELSVVEPALIYAYDLLVLWKGPQHKFAVLHAQETAPGLVDLERDPLYRLISHTKILFKDAAYILLGDFDTVLQLDRILDLLDYHEALLGLQKLCRLIQNCSQFQSAKFLLSFRLLQWLLPPLVLNYKPRNEASCDPEFDRCLFVAQLLIFDRVNNILQFLGRHLAAPQGLSPSLTLLFFDFVEHLLDCWR